MEYNHSEMVQRKVAVEYMLNARHRALACQSTEIVSLGEGIDGHMFAKQIDAGKDVPAIDHATMDGYAVNARDMRRRLHPHRPISQHR